MVAEVIDGRRVAADMLADVPFGAAEFERRHGRKPCLATVLVGDDPASHTYVRMKTNRCRANGIESRNHWLPGSATTGEAVALVARLSADVGVDGILVQHPMPSHVDERTVFEAIEPSKDVDGVTIASFGSMALGGSAFRSCTPGAIMALLDAYAVELSGRHAVVVGRSAILGKPMGMLLLGRDATVTYCHSHTRDLPGVVSAADVLVAATGRAGLVRGDWVKPGAVVIDAGYDRNVGDVEFGAAAERASLITPVPGGVGPVTIAVLLRQTVRAATRFAAEG